MNRNFKRQKFHVRKVKCLVRATKSKMSVWRMEISDVIWAITNYTRLEWSESDNLVPRASFNAKFIGDKVKTLSMLSFTKF